MNQRLIPLICKSLFLIVLGGIVESAPAQTRLFVTNNLTNNAPGGRLLEFNGTNGQFVSLVANINTPRGIAVGPDGNLYVASANADSILKFDVGNGLQQTTFVPAGSGGLDVPSGLTFGADGNLY